MQNDILLGTNCQRVYPCLHDADAGTLRSVRKMHCQTLTWVKWYRSTGRYGIALTTVRGLAEPRPQESNLDAVS
eukprot:m.240737 g.240737  ORF g.240737 m.240737 type:complete len:74 (+) comp50886_c0_seq1:104-325(+)